MSKDSTLWAQSLLTTADTVLPLSLLYPVSELLTEYFVVACSCLSVAVYHVNVS